MRELDDGVSPPAGQMDVATVAFVDLAGFSAIADVFGDRAALAVLEVFEDLVALHSGADGRLVKWIGDEAMLAFPDPDSALVAFGRLLPACRSDDRIPLTRTALHHGPVIARRADLFGATVNIAARMSTIAKPGELLSTGPVAEAATRLGIETRALGPTTLRSMQEEVPLFAIGLTEAADPAWIDPVCKMHAPYAAFQREKPAGPWFCSPRCEEAFKRSPQTYSD